MIDDFDAPLRRQPSRPEKSPRRRWGVVALVALAGVVAWRVGRIPSTDGEPIAVASIEIEPEPAPAAPPPSPPPQAPELAAPPAIEVDERVAGVKITRHGEGGGNVRIIRVEPASDFRLPAAPDRRVVEKGRYGPLPKVASDGARPMDVYARPFTTPPALREGAPRLALVVGGIGLNPDASIQAIEELPPATTLAFAP